MGRRRKSKEAAGVEAIASVIGFGLLLSFISQGFQHWIQISVVALVIASAGVLGIWLICKENKADSSSSLYRTSALNCQTGAPTKAKPTPIVEVLRYVDQVPELTISQKLRKIDWFQFEKLVELIYQHRGFSVKRMGGANPDGGVDLIVESPAEEFVVQCKHWKKWTVGVRHIREFLGTLTDSRIPKGVFITLVGYTGEAKQLADKHGIQILNESDLIRMLEESGLQNSKEISRLLSDERKVCPKCEKEMVLRTARANGNQFWGCSGFPRCRFKMNFEG